MKLYIKVILTFLLLTGSLYPKSTRMQSINIELIKFNYFFNIKNKRVSMAFLIKPVSIYSDLSLDFEKVHFMPIR